MTKTNFKPGIYFNLSNEDYHADLSISCSGVKDLLKNPLTYWWNSALNPDKEPLDTEAFVYGRAAHCLLLEPEKFDQDYIVLPMASKLKIGSNFYNKVKNLPNFEKEFQMPKTEGATTFKYIGKKDVIIEKQNARKKPDFLKMTQAVTVIKEDEFYDDWFKDGYPEVSIFWRDKATGLYCRSKFDRLNLEFIFDFKTTLSVHGDNIEQTISKYQYNLQSAIYSRGLGDVLGNKDIHIEGNDEQKEWVKSLAKNPDFNFRFLFQEKTPPYITRAGFILYDTLKSSDILFQMALNIYKINFEKYGVKRWGSGYNKLEEFKLPIWADMKLEKETQPLQPKEF